MAGQTPQQIAEKQVRRASAAVQDYKDGITSCKVNPMEEAAKSVDRWFQGVQKSMNDGTFVDGCLATPKQVWIDAATKKGANAYVPGIQAAQSTIADFHAQRQQAQNGIDSVLAGMPRGDLNSNIQRMLAQVQGMSNFKFRKRRGG